LRNLFDVRRIPLNSSNPLTILFFPWRHAALTAAERWLGVLELAGWTLFDRWRPAALPVE